MFPDSAVAAIIMPIFMVAGSCRFCRLLSGDARLGQRRGFHQVRGAAAHLRPERRGGPDFKIHLMDVTASSADDYKRPGDLGATHELRCGSGWRIADSSSSNLAC